jgi:hypothetical protein
VQTLQPWDICNISRISQTCLGPLIVLIRKILWIIWFSNILSGGWCYLNQMICLYTINIGSALFNSVFSNTIIIYSNVCYIYNERPSSSQNVHWLYISIYIYIYIYVWKLNQTVLELDFRAVKFLFFPRRDLIPHHWSNYNIKYICTIYTRLYTCLTSIPRFTLRERVTLGLLKLLF